MDGFMFQAQDGDEMLDVEELIETVESLLQKACDLDEDFGGVNWSDLKVVDVMLYLSLMHPEDGPAIIVTISEASPNSSICGWLQGQIDKEKYPNVGFVAEW